MHAVSVSYWDWREKRCILGCNGTDSLSTYRQRHNEHLSRPVLNSWLWGASKSSCLQGRFLEHRPQLQVLLVLPNLPHPLITVVETLILVQVSRFVHWFLSHFEVPVWKKVCVLAPTLTKTNYYSCGMMNCVYKIKQVYTAQFNWNSIILYRWPPEFCSGLWVQ